MTHREKKKELKTARVPILTCSEKIKIKSSASQ